MKLWHKMLKRISPLCLSLNSFLIILFLSNAPLHSESIIMNIDNLVCTLVGGTIADDQTVCYDGDPDEITSITPASGCVGMFTYQWQSSTTNCSDNFTDIPMETNETFTPPGGATQTTYYRRKAICDDEPGCIAYSNCVTVTIVQATAGITQTDNSGNSNDGIICNGGSAMLTASGGVSYIWSPNIGAGAGPYSVSPMVTTNYTVTVTDANGCQDTAEETVIVVDVIATITETDNSGSDPDDGEICEGSSAQLMASGGVSYVWDPDIGMGAGPHTVSPAIETFYNVTVTDANGCTDVESFDLNVRSNPSGTLTETDNSGSNNDDGEICEGDNATLTASGGSSYEWSTTESTAAIVVSPIMTTTYTVTISNSFGCTDIHNFEVIVHETITASCPADISVCESVTNYVLTGGLPTGGTYSGPGITTSPVFDATSAGPGTHIITYSATDAGGCGFSDDCMFNVTVIATPVHNVDTDEYFCNLTDAIDDANTLDNHVIEMQSFGSPYTDCTTVNKGVNLTAIGGSVTLNCITINGSNIHVTMGSNLIISDLMLINGKLHTNSFNLRCDQITGGSPASYIITD